MWKKIRILIDGIVIPFLVYLGVTFLFTVVSIAFAIVFLGYDLNQIANINAVIVQGIADIFVIATLVPLYLSFKKKYDIGKGRLTFRKTIYLIPLAFSICIISNIVLQYLPSTKDNVVSKAIEEVIEKHGILVSILLTAVLIPIVEELVFRGFIYGATSLLGGAVFAIAFTSTLFGLIHFNLEQGIYGIFAGAFLGYVRYKYDSVLYTIFMHLIMNACSIIFVPSIVMLSGVKEKIFIIIICIVLMIMSIYRIRVITKISDDESNS